MMLDLEIAGEIEPIKDGEAVPTQTSVILKTSVLRDSHHAVARLVAQGRRDMEISALTGYSPGRIATLHRDPSFQELVAFYRREEDAANQDFMDRMGVVARDILQSVHDDILDLPYLAFKDKVEAFKVVTDRAGYAPVQRSISKSMNYTIAERMDAARKRKDDAA